MTTRHQLIISFIFVSFCLLHLLHQVAHIHQEFARPSSIPLAGLLQSIFSLPIKHCDVLFNDKSPAEFFSSSPKILLEKKRFEEKVRQVIRHTGLLLEGHVGQLQVQAQTYYTLVRLPFVRRVCEIGFNAGHSAFICLASNVNISLVSFDINRYPHVKPMARHVEALFPGRFTIVYGDSTRTVPKYNSSLYSQCDLVIVDGGHRYEIAKQDLENMRSLANPVQNIVVFDDYPIPGKKGEHSQLERAWKSLVNRGYIKEVFGCTFKEKQHQRGFTVGMYTY